MPNILYRGSFINPCAYLLQLINLVRLSLSCFSLFFLYFVNYKLSLFFFHREKESSDHALMLRELQKLVTDERSAKEKLETELQSVKDSLKALQLAGTYNAEYEKRVRDLVSFLYLQNLVYNISCSPLVS